MSNEKDDYDFVSRPCHCYGGKGGSVWTGITNLLKQRDIYHYGGPASADDYAFRGE